MLTKYTILIAITFLSFSLRVGGLQFGLPFAYHPDEQQYILPAMQVVSGNFEPQAHYNPTLYPYLIGLVFSLSYWGLALFDLAPQPFSLEAAWSPSMQVWTSGMIYLARYVSVSVGVLTTLLVYQLGRRAYGHLTGLGAALIFGGTFLPAREAHFAVSDAPVALGVTVTLYYCLAILRRGHLRDYLTTGVALGLTTGLKYTAGLLALPIIVAHVLRPTPNRLRTGWRVLLTGLISGLSYAIVSPYTFIQFEEFWLDFSENLESAQRGFQGLALDPSGSGAIFYLRALQWGFEWPLCLAGLLSLLILLLRHRRVDLLLLTFPLLGFIYMQRQEMYFARWLMPFLPPLALLTAEGVRGAMVCLSNRLTQRRLSLSRGSVVPTIYLILLLLLTAPSTYTAARAAEIFRQPDTRSQALAWVEQHIPPSETVAVALLGPPWGPPLAMPGLAVGPYNFVPVPDGGLMEVPLSQYQAWGVRYLIASSFHYDRRLRDEAHQATLTRNLQTLHEQAELVAHFEPYHTPYEGFFYHDQIFGPANDVHYRRQPGPEIRVYRLGE